MLCASLNTVARHSINKFTIVGSVRYAADVTRMGYEKEGQCLLAQDNDKSVKNKKKLMLG